MNGQFQNKIFNFLGTILTTLLIGCAAVGLALFLTIVVSPLILKVPNSFLGLSKAAVYRDYFQLLKYLITPWPQSRLSLPGIPMTVKAVSHFADVRHLVIIGLLLAVGSLLGTIKVLKCAKKSWQLWKLSAPLKYLTALMVVGGGMMLVDFDDAFIEFHYLAFNNTDWVFSPIDDPIINLFTEQFFTMLFGSWWLFTILFLVLLQWSISRYLRTLV